MKEVKLKIEEILSMKSGLDLVLESQELPMKTRYWFGRLADSIESVSKSVQKQDEVLIKTKYGVEDKDTGNWKVPTDKLLAYQTDKSSLLKEVDTIKVPDLKLSELLAYVPFKTVIILRNIINDDLPTKKITAKEGKYTMQQLINISMAIMYFYEKPEKVDSDETKNAKAKKVPVILSDKTLVTKLLTLKNTIAPIVEQYNNDIDELNLNMTEFNKAGQQVPIKATADEYAKKSELLSNKEYTLKLPVLKFEDIESQDYLPGNFFKLTSSYLAD